MKNVLSGFTFKLVITFLHVLTAFVWAQSIKVIWTPNEEPDISGYNIYRKSLVDSSLALISSVSHPENSYVDQNIESNSFYFYSVTAVDTAGNESDFSKFVETQTVFPQSGRIKRGDSTHFNDVHFTFMGSSGELVLLYQVYDIDSEDEVDVILNGVKIHDEKVTANLSWSSTRTLLLADEMVDDSAINEVRFVNVKNMNAGKRFYWGVRAIRVAACLSLPFMDEAGRIRNDQYEHVNEACFTFDGQAGDLILDYEIFDIDHPYELDILLNGMKIHDEAITGNNEWSGPRFIQLPDTLVDDVSTNIVVFENTKNPPKSWLWGVRSLTVAPTNTSFAAIEPTQTTTTRGTMVPTTFQLSQNFPNPFNPDTIIRFTVPNSGEVKLAIYNLSGELVRYLVKDEIAAGAHTFKLDASDLASGIYLYRLEAGPFTAVRKMVLAK